MTIDREIVRTAAFKRDFKREKRKDAHVEDVLRPVVEDLVHDRPLAEKYRDHALTGTTKGDHDCHIKPNLVLIYRKPDAETLELVRIGSHAELDL
jgi:mRNA interferase YafQ